MERECIQKLIEWKNSRKRKPLVLMGARQVGKTWLMEEFAKREFGEDYVIVNFMRRQSLCQQLKLMDLDPKALVRLLQTATGRRIVPGKTLLILDEIQECPKALTSLKFFYEDMPELAVMAAGSLLGLSYGKGEKGDLAEDGDRGSFPVGKVDRLNVYPMSFAEFLVASGKTSLSGKVPGRGITRRLWSGCRMRASSTSCSGSAHRVFRLSDTWPRAPSRSLFTMSGCCAP